ncbi:transposon-transfer assisting family protein [uncultured Oscillibacter sp.]|uniref:transposon-transfer assisting family protein n=1 Tax=uncultured Oscillibacter sp. TaxID=876091 RepID=UPI0026364638|nr:transposon-transfer assisting family protein [uncultured Oscillibacter sp.]
MNEFTFEETNLLCIYNGSGGGTREGLIAFLEEMRGYLEPDEDELRDLTDSALSKLRSMSDGEFDALDLYPDFDAEDAAHAE